MLARTFDGGLSAKRVAADEAYGSNGRFRRFLEARRLGYVVAISSPTHLLLDGKRAAVAMHVELVPREAWRTISCGSGSKGERLYDWAFAEWNSYGIDGFRRGLLIGRSIADPSDLAYYFTHAPQGTPPTKLIEIAGSRWAVGECFEQAKHLVGLDEYEFRAWRLVPSRHARDAGSRDAGGDPRGGDRGVRPAFGVSPAFETKRLDLVPLTVAEVRRLIVAIVRQAAPPDPPHRLAFSRWRRRHQANAKVSHYRRRSVRTKQVRL